MINGLRAPHLYLITDRHASHGRDVVDVIEDALAAIADFPGPGAEVWRIAVQLRDKDLDGRRLWHYAERLRRVTGDHACALFVNGRLDVALAVGADGVHLGHGALPVSTVHAVAPGLAVALSTHSEADVRQAREDGANFAVYGPVFATPSKVGILEPVGLHGLAQAAAVGMPLLALGGVDASNVHTCLQAGAVGVAGIRWLMAAPSPAKTMFAFLKAWRANEPSRS